MPNSHLDFLDQQHQRVTTYKGIQDDSGTLLGPRQGTPQMKCVWNLQRLRSCNIKIQYAYMFIKNIPAFKSYHYAQNLWLVWYTPQNIPKHSSIHLVIHDFRRFKHYTVLIWILLNHLRYQLVQYSVRHQLYIILIFHMNVRQLYKQNIETHTAPTW